MSIGYTIRTRNVFKKSSKKPFSLSRSKIELFIECPRCFWFDRVKGIGRPAGFPFNLNNAVDILLKKEFDISRELGTSHHLMKKYGIEAIPFAHPNIDEWRDSFRGIRYHDKESNLILFGGVDDIWVNQKGELHVVDYKATSKEGDVSLDAQWQRSYKRQVEIYQWLLRNNTYNVSPLAYFVYTNGLRDKSSFDSKLEFDTVILEYRGDTSWIDSTLQSIKDCLHSEDIPTASETCDYCAYVDAREQCSSQNHKALSQSLFS